MANPIPLVPPVTTAILFPLCPTCFLSSRAGFLPVNSNVSVGSVDEIPTASLEMQCHRGMAWDTQETRRSLQQAACEEFASHGPDGTTMARIAALAGINKERLYNYFGDKRLLFETVLIDELEKLAIALGANAPGLDDIGEYTGCIFDYHAANPHLVRLSLWEGLSDGPAVNEAARTAHYQRTVARFAEAQRNGILTDDLDPAKLLFLLIGLAHGGLPYPS